MVDNKINLVISASMVGKSRKSLHGSVISQSNAKSVLQSLLEKNYQDVDGQSKKRESGTDKEESKNPESSFRKYNKLVDEAILDEIILDEPIE